MQNSTTILCKSFAEFNEFINTHKEDHKIVAYDVETNARETHSKDHRVIGFSIAFDGNIGCYVPIKALDFQLTPSDKRLIEKKLRSLLSDNTSLVYNCMHEYPVTLNWLNLEMPSVDDLFVMVKLMMGNAERYAGNGGLKAQSVMHLGYDNWSDDVQIYFSLLRQYHKNQSEETELKLRRLLLNYYTMEEIPGILDLIKSIPDSEYDESVMSYEYIPYKVVGTYGSLDSTVLFDLKEFYENWMKELGEELGVDLFKGYKYWMDHHYAGYILERNGAYWNDAKAQEVEDWCNQGMIDSLKALIRHPLSQDYLSKNLEFEYINYLMHEESDLLSPDYTPRRLNKSSMDVICNNELAEIFLKTMSLQPKILKNGTRVYKLQLGNFKTIVKDKMSKGLTPNKSWDDFFKDYVEDILATNDVSVMKKLLNPTATSSDFKEFISRILISDDIRIAKIYKGLLTLTELPTFDIDLHKDFFDARQGVVNNSPKKSYKFDIKEFKRSNNSVEFRDTDNSKLLESVIKINGKELPNKDKFRLFKKVFSNFNAEKADYYVKKVLKDALSYNLYSLDEGNVLELFSYYEFTGIDIEDDSTWNDNFKWLYNYRWYKKYSKVTSVYVYGNVGRASVWLVPKEEFESGELLTRRVCRYYSEEGTRIRNNPEELKNYDMVLQTNFLVNMADSGRWKATMHTMPSGDTVKGFITSRYKGGVIAMPDCSQAEVRVLAAQAQDENLLKYFRSGGSDIHLHTASLINQIPEEQVTKQQRKLAKGSTFGILYGESENSFARENFNGDLEKAHYVFESYFNTFPGIRDYVNESHAQYDKWKKVTLPITGRYIDMTSVKVYEPDPNRIYRQCQNMRIQGQTVDVAGMILYNICDYISKNSLKSKPFCFIHDSIEIDLHPDETFRMLDELRPLFNEYPDEKFGVPMASDIVFSMNMGAEIEVVELIHDEDYNDVTITLDGFESDIEAVIENWKTVYDVVEKDESFEGKRKEEYIPMKGLFTPKVTISKEFGTTKYKGTQRYHIIRKAV